MTDHQRAILRVALEQMEEKMELVWGPEWMDEVAAALRALLDENAALRATRTAELAKANDERDEARRLLKSVVDVVQESMLPTQSVPNHICDYDRRPDIGMCKVCEDFTDAVVMFYPDELKDAKP